MESKKLWRESHKHPCIDCGKICSYEAERCRSCGNRYAWTKRQRQQPKYCADCQKPISPYAARCRQCATKHLWETGLYPAEASIKGDQHPFWKGAVYQDKGSYKRVAKPEHTLADRDGYVMEHVLVWESVHGHPLPKGWVVHHLNGIKNDNRPSNLVALPHLKPKLVLRAKARRIQELESITSN